MPPDKFKHIQQQNNTNVCGIYVYLKPSILDPTRKYTSLQDAYICIYLFIYLF
jgi:hypothetical protein